MVNGVDGEVLRAPRQTWPGTGLFCLLWSSFQLSFPSVCCPVSVSRPLCLSLSACLSVYLPVYLPVCLLACLSVLLALRNCLMYRQCIACIYVPCHVAAGVTLRMCPCINGLVDRVTYSLWSTATCIFFARGQTCLAPPIGTYRLCHYGPKGLVRPSLHPRSWDFPMPFYFRMGSHSTQRRSFLLACLRVRPSATAEAVWPGTCPDS
ncbi:hypothetical protein F4861DRAFT_322923 [Xylaria intraflava]|nr:hypothetical protein F4861DRAFT_322923 [Xylaria intraflava]